MNNSFGRQGGKLLSLPSAYTFLLLKTYRQRKFIRAHLEPILQRYRENDGSLQEADFKKITNYYALGVPGVLGETFCVLRGKSMEVQERICLTYLGGISGLLDDLFDDPKKEVTHLKEFIRCPRELTPHNDYETLLLHLYTQGLEAAKHPELLKKRAKEIFKSQQKSLQQQGQPSTAGELEEITWSKGGHSFLFYRLCLNNPLSTAEERLQYQLGGLMQLGNDLFDVWEDKQAGINTIATECSDIEILREKIILKLKEVKSLARATSYPSKNTERFLNLIGLALGRVFVCLDQFERLQTESGGVFSIKDYDRKQLICDMQKPGNQYKAINYYLQHY